jgi:transcriptional regulator with XRE-family HTH domain
MEDNLLLEKIDKLCKANGISISKLEKALFLGKGTIYKWTNSLPNSDKLRKVAKYFDVSMEYLLDEDTGRLFSSDIINIARELHKLSSEDFKLVSKLIYRLAQ